MTKAIEKVAGVISLCRHPISPELSGVETILGPEDLCGAVFPRDPSGHRGSVSTLFFYSNIATYVIKR